MNQVEELESAILARAERLAEEYRERAERSRERILREAADQLRLREDREVLVAKALAERNYRRKVQASELKLRAHMDHLRWNLVRGVEQRLAERVEAFSADAEAYDQALAVYLAQAARILDQEELVAEVNARDHQRLKDDWDAFVAQAVPERHIRLADRPIDSLGGVRVSSPDGRVRLDNTFEGRRDRLQPKLHQVIVERLFPATGEG